MLLLLRRFQKRDVSGWCVIDLNKKFLLHLTFKKKSPTVQEEDCGATGFYGFYLRREHEESCSVVYILLISSGMSTGKLKSRQG
jgi:hypothetical protein